MKARMLASVAVVALIVVGPAHAADLPLKAPPKVAPWTWSGFYLGGHAGYGWSHDSLSTVDDPFFNGKFPGFGPSGYNGQGWLAGFHAGANWQDGKIVGGLEIDLSATDIRGASTRTVGPVLFGAPPFQSADSGSATNSGKFEWLGSARGRLGILATPDLLLYGTGGLAWTHYVHNEDLRVSRTTFLVPPIDDGIFSSVSTANWRFGWVAGIGGEMRLPNSNWLARLEYLHYDFGQSDTTVTSALFAGPWPRTGGNLTADVVRAGLSYKFDPDRFAMGYPGSAAAVAPVRYAKAPLAPVPWTWAGFYLGAHGGYGWADDPFNNRLARNEVLLPNGVDSRGWLAGFHTGANWQSRSVVGGLELDISATDIKGSVTGVLPGISTATQSDKFDPLGSVRARLGYLVTPNVLLYGTGGLGWTQFTNVNSTSNQVPAAFTTQNWLFGWVAGAGVEARLGNTNWLGRIEYLHYDFGNTGSFRELTPAGAIISANGSGNLTADVVRAGLSYKLNWPDPAGAAAGSSAIIAKAPVVQAWSWSGFSVGGHGGYGWGKDESTRLVQPSIFFLPPPPPVVVPGLNADGYVAGFQAAASWQSANFVGGLEIDLSKTGIKGSSFAAGFDGGGDPISGAVTDKFDLLGSVRARLGYLVRPDLLLYGTGGLGWTRLEQTVTNTNQSRTITETPSWRAGWVAGAGGQLRLGNSNWLVRIEYLHYDFGRSTGIYSGFVDPNTPPPGLDIERNTTPGRLTTDVVRAGIDYKFD